MRASELVKTIMMETNLDQKEIAEHIGCAQATISRIKKNKQKVGFQLTKALVILAKKYKIKIELEDII